MLNKASHSDLDTMLQYEAYCQEIAGRSEDYKEGVAAFNEKRKPEFIQLEKTIQQYEKCVIQFKNSIDVLETSYKKLTLKTEQIKIDRF